MKVTPYLRDCLDRMACADGPLTLDEVRNGHPNRMPTILCAGWARSVGEGLYEITEEGLHALEVGE